jgi:hypothetical protein
LYGHVTLRSFDTVQLCTDPLVVYSRNRLGLSFEMSIHLIELIDIEIGQTSPLTGSIDSPCFFRGFFARYIIHQLSTRRR